MVDAGFSPKSDDAGQLSSSRLLLNRLIQNQDKDFPEEQGATKMAVSNHLTVQSTEIRESSPGTPKHRKQVSWGKVVPINGEEEAVILDLKDDTDTSPPKRKKSTTKFKSM